MVIVLSIINSLQLFDVLYTLTGGGPGRQTTVMSYYIYLRAFTSLSLGYSSALAVVLLAMIVLASSSLLLLRSRGRRRSDAAADVDDLESAQPLPFARTTSRRGAAAALPRWEPDDIGEGRRRRRPGAAAWHSASA